MTFLHTLLMTIDHINSVYKFKQKINYINDVTLESMKFIMNNYKVEY